MSTRKKSRFGPGNFMILVVIGIIAMTTLPADGFVIVDAQTTDMALAYTAEGAREIVETALQLYGGMGFTWENPVHLHLRHALRCGPLLGTPRALSRSR